MKNTTLRNLNKKIMTTLALTATLLLTSQANAGLIERTITVAGGADVAAYYDNVLDITWLKDANYAKTSGYTGASTDGRMNWGAANTWANNLVIGSFNDWRLTDVQPQNSQAGFNYGYSADGSTDYGNNITSPMSELAYMFNVNLGLGGYCDAATSSGATCGSAGGSQWHNTPSNTAINTSSLGNNIAIDNLMSYVYWNKPKYAPVFNGAWAFSTNFGDQLHYDKFVRFYGWAVRSGDVGAPLQPTASVPEPTTLAIFGLGLLGLVIRRKSA